MQKMKQKVLPQNKYPDFTMDSSMQAPAADQEELSRFQKLHPDDPRPGDSFLHLVQSVGLERVREYLNQLETVFNSLPKPGHKAIIMSHYSLNKISQDMIITSLKEESTDEVVKQLLHLAHFKRYPLRDSSYLSETEILTALEAPDVIPYDPHSVETTQWHHDIVKQGLCAEYKNSDMIVTPNLNLIRAWATQWSNKEYKAPYTSIIGPTMSGKTRLLMEFGKHVCVVYICLRPQDSIGQPPRSSIADFMYPIDTKMDLHLHYSRFLIAIFEVVAEFFKSQPKSNNVLAEWSNYSFQLDDTQNASAFSARVQQKMQETWHGTPSDCISLVEAAISKMNASIDFITSGQLKVILAFDEARHLVNVEDQSHQISYFQVLRHVLSQIPPLHGFFAVFTDTTSKVANFLPAVDPDSSSFGHDDLFPPIYQLATFDVMVKPKPNSWEELLSPFRLFSYGSPFYGPYFASVFKLEPMTAIEQTLGIAQSKIFGCEKLASPQDLKVEQIFALLGSTIQTRLTSSEMNSKLVSSHAAHCMFINSSRNLIVSQYPSHFVYAAASNAFLASHDKHFVTCIIELATAMQKGLISQGDAGEMATRIILLRAMHQTKPLQSTTYSTIPGGHSVRLVDFLQTLTGKDPYSLSFGPIVPADKLRLLNEGRIFFNHFIRINYTPSKKHFMELLYRGLAVQCKPGQPGLDQLFTIYLAPTNHDTLNHQHITFCGIQTKNQEDSIDWKSSYEWSKTGAGITGISNPYLILLFSLKSKETRRKPKAWTSPSDSKDRRRAYLQFLGLDAIACLTPQIRTALERLINSMQEDVMQLHGPKPNATDVAWVKRLNPMFYSEDEQIDVYPKHSPPNPI